MNAVRRSLGAMLLLVGLLGTLPGVAGGQEDLRARVRAAWGPEVARSIETVVEEAVARGVPEEPLLEKALEGAAKGVPAPRVVGALAAWAEQLHAAATLLPEGAGGADLVAAADALRRGVPGEVVGETVREHPRSGPAALVVLADLVEAGVPTGDARTVVADALARGRGPADLLDLPSRVRRLIREGHHPADAARALGPPEGAGPPQGVGPGSGGGPPAGPPVPPGTRGPGKGKGPPGGKPPGGGGPGGGGGGAE